MYCFFLNYLLVCFDLLETDTTSLKKDSILIQVEVPLPAEKSD